MSSDDLIDRYLTHLRERGSTPKTLKVYGRTLRALDRELPLGLDVATEVELRTWLWRDGLKLSSRATYYGAMAGFFRWAAVDEEVLDFDPTARMPRPTVPRGIPRVARDQHVRIIIEQAAEPYRTWGRLAAYAGLRCIEILRLDRDDVTVEKIAIYGKGDKPRHVPTHPLIWDVVKDLPPGHVADVADEQEISQRFFLYCQRKLDVQGVSLHRFRGWWATNTYRITKDIRAVQHGMGHANPATTAGYIDVADTELQAMVAGLPTFGVEVDGH